MIKNSTRKSACNINNRKSRSSLISSISAPYILKILLAMEHGSLTIELPDGKILESEEKYPGINIDLHILDNEFFERCTLFGAIGFAESYIVGQWRTSDLTALLSWFIDNQNNSTLMDGKRGKSLSIDIFSFINRLLHLSRKNSKTGSSKNIRAHYDLSNEFFRLFLDPSMTYSSALFSSANQSLEDAQIAKYDRICRKSRITSSDKILEIGCGWGGFAIHAARRYGASITAITISREQFEFARKRVAEEALENLIEIRLEDYRDTKGSFDKIVSIEMVEALGDEGIDQFFSRCSHLLAQDGLLAIQSINCCDSRYEQIRSGVDFIQKHIFPGSLLLSIDRIMKAKSDNTDLNLVDLHDFSSSYARTLKSWRSGLISELETIRAMGFDEKFINRWLYYFSYCEAAFATRQISVSQTIFARSNNRALIDRELLS